MRWGGGRFATKTFQADGAFSDSATNDEVYERMGVLNNLEECVKVPGSSVSILAYGQTGCGKTYTTTAIEGALQSIGINTLGLD
jgi:kinesin family protein 2/24